MLYAMSYNILFKDIIEHHNQELLIANNINTNDRMKCTETFYFIAQKIKQHSDGKWIIKFKCPYCFQRYSKFGTKYKTPKNQYHEYELFYPDLENHYIDRAHIHNDKIFNFRTYITNDTGRRIQYQ